MVNALRLQFIFVYELTTEERERAIGEINRLLEANRLIHNIAKTMPLSDIIAAHEAVESGQVAGNVVLTVGN